MFWSRSNKMYATNSGSSKKQDTMENFVKSDILKNISTHNRETTNDDLSTSSKSNLHPDNVRLYTIVQQEYSIVAEYEMLLSENLHGIYVIPSFESSFLWFGVIFVRCGYYEGGVFRFSVVLPETFPNCETPSIMFQSQIFHPSVDPNTGNLNLKEVFPKWTKSSNHIYQVLKYIHWIFQNVNVKMPSNSEALKIYKTNKVLFAEKAKESVMSSIDHLYDEPPTNDKHYICFSPYDPSVHDSVKTLMLNQSKSSDESSQGLSWVEPGTFQPFTKNDSETR